jgi:rod shape-determining protein MreC
MSNVLDELMLKRPHYVALGVVVILTIVLLKLPSRTASNLKLAISGSFLPLFGLASSAEKLANGSSYAAIPKHALIERLQQIEKENREAQLRLMQAEEAKKENARLRQQLGMAQRYAWKSKLARVIARDPANWWRTLRIDLGSRDGVVTNAPVLTADGFVGRVSEVGFATSQVVLIGDPDCRVAVLVGEGANREQGVIAPSSSSPLDSTLVDLSYLSRNAKLAVGMPVVTSGIGGIFPPGILVGQIADFRTVGYGLYREARVSLAVKLNSLEEVWVKMP